MRRHSDDGATLLLVLGFTLLVGAIMGALLPFITTSFSARTSLDTIRNREYAADVVIEESIAHVRGLTSPGVQACGPFSRSVNGFTIHVDCANQPTLIRKGVKLLEQRNVRFTACEGVSACTDATTIVRAQVNFEVPPSGTSVTRTYIQSWSVNK